MKMLFVGPLWSGSTALQRRNAFLALPELQVHSIDTMERVGNASLSDRIRHKLRWPADRSNLNGRVIAETAALRPDVVFVDSSRVFTHRTVRLLKSLGTKIAFYSPDDVSQRHNSSRQLEECDREWTIFFTTKSFNVAELAARGVRLPMLVGKSFDPAVHRPLTPSDVGDEFERFDCVFAGAFEYARLHSINRLSDEKIQVVTFGNGWRGLHPNVVLRPAVFAADYTSALHRAKIALCFLRKINRDQVTQRSVEIPAMQRPMLAEKTKEHDQMFKDGTQYISFTSDNELVHEVRRLLADRDLRTRVALAGRERCLNSGYAAVDRAQAMLQAIRKAAI